MKASASRQDTGRHALLAETSYWFRIRQILLKIAGYNCKAENWATLAEERPRRMASAELGPEPVPFYLG